MGYETKPRDNTEVPPQAEFRDDSHVIENAQPVDESEATLAEPEPEPEPELVTTPGEAAADETPAAEDEPASEAAPAPEEPAVVDETPTAEEASTAEEPSAVEEPSPIEEPSAVDETDETPVAEATAAEDVVATEDVAATDELASVDETPAVEDATEESASVDETPTDATSAVEPTAEADVASDEPVAEADELMPGDMAVQPVTLWSAVTVSDLRGRWQAVQLRFVDDPPAVAAEMQALVGEAVQILSAALADRQRELDEWSQTGVSDTEQLRIAVQRYRDFFDLMLGR
jgi:hypothetical protein